MKVGGWGYSGRRMLYDAGNGKGDKDGWDAVGSGR